jgi:hypothetical protein
LTRLGVDVILTPGPDATIAARKATSLIPIVMIGSTDPRAVGAGGLARPGGNVTGLTIGQPELVIGKRLELLKEALPGISHVAILWDVKPVGDADRTANQFFLRWAIIRCPRRHSPPPRRRAPISARRRREKLAEYLKQGSASKADT